MPPPKSEILQDFAWLVRVLGVSADTFRQGADSGEPCSAAQARSFQRGSRSATLSAAGSARPRVRLSAPERLRVLLAQLDVEPRLPLRLTARAVAPCAPRFRSSACGARAAFSPWISGAVFFLVRPCSVRAVFAASAISRVEASETFFPSGSRP